MKKLLATILSLVLIISTLPMGMIVVSAETTVQTKINEINKKYPTGSFFSVNGKACTHGQMETCNNCKLSNICPEATKVCTNAWTCLAFARYAFWYIFGLSPDAQTYQWATLDNINTIAKPGDFITFYNSAGSYYHAAIYLGPCSNGFYAYTSNYTKANDIKYNREYTTTSGYPDAKKYANSKFKVFHASNYDSINSSENNTVTISSQSNKNTVTNTNAILWGKVDKPSDYAVAKIGIKIRQEDSTYENGWSKEEVPSKDYVGYSYMEPYYNMNTELNISLRHATTYYYKFYAKVNGKEYWSAEYSIKTTGSHSFGSWSTTKSATCTTVGTKTRTCSCGKYETADIPATGIHSFFYVGLLSEATCTESAKDKWICDMCDLEITVSDPDNRPALGHAYSNNYDTSCDRCGAFAYPGGNVLYKENGKFYHIVNRQKVNDTTLVKHTDGNWYFVNNGIVDFSRNGLFKHNGKFYHIVGGKVVFDTTLVKHTDGNWYFVNNGTVDFSRSGLFNYNGKFYHLVGGKVVFDTTLVKHTDGNWYYVENGAVDFTQNGLFPYNGEWWYLQGGKLNFNANTLCAHNGQWWHVQGGKVNFNSNNTLCAYNGQWWHVQNGKVNFNSNNTLCAYNGQWWYIQNGKVNFNANTLCAYNGQWWHVQNGKVNFNSNNTLCAYNGQWWFIQNGKANFSANTLCAYNGKWWHVQGGKVNFNSNNTFCAYNGKWFYIKNGAADFTKNGKVYYYGKYYTVKNGTVV